MIFTTATYAVFFAIFFALYWAARRKVPQNALLLVGGYVFYGWVHPWFCILLAASTVCDFFLALAIERWQARRKAWLVASLVFNLGLLGTFKYFNFFASNVHDVLAAIGFDVHPITLRVVLPVGISFYTFQSIGYVVDVYRGKAQARRNFLDYAAFVSFFPQMVAGPIERAHQLLPQIERPRTWSWDRFLSAWPLIVRGCFKKMVVADTVAPYVDQVYSLQEPTTILLYAATVAFAVQIVCDFSGYSDIARGSARLLGIDLMVNFDEPYLATSPSDFWRRWHISFSRWIRDYIYIPMGGSRVAGWRFAFVIIATMGISGLWHGAAWNYVVWGLFHGVILYAYHLAGMGGRWAPAGTARTAAAWFAMFNLTIVGWMLFRTTSVEWVWDALARPSLGSSDTRLVAVAILALVAFYVAPLLLLSGLRGDSGRARRLRAAVYGVMIAGIVILRQSEARDFIYFQF